MCLGKQQHGLPLLTEKQEVVGEAAPAVGRDGQLPAPRDGHSDVCYPEVEIQRDEVAPLLLRGRHVGAQDH